MTVRARALVVAAFAVLLACAVPGGRAEAAVFEVGHDGSFAVRTPGAEAAWDENEGDDPVPDVPAAAVTMIAAPDVPTPYSGALQQSAERYGISANLLAAMVGRESAWRPAAVSAKGAQGLAQLMPATARMLGVDARDPFANLAGGARYLRQMLDRFNGDVERALAAYNAGPGRVSRAGGIPAIAETRAYVAAIINRVAPGAPAINLGLVR